MKSLPQIVLGRTGLTVTRLGIGGAYCESADIYKAALDCGVNYVDTARSYRDGEDEKVIGQAIQGRRDDLILATKTLKRDADGAREELETSLKLLGTDYVDIYQLHHLNTQAEREQALGAGGALEAVQKARDEGLVRFIGVTGHDWVQVQAALDTDLFDTVLCWYNCAMREPEETVFPEALARNVGVIIMNATRNDKLLRGPDAPRAEQFYRYVLNHEAVHVTIRGLRDIETFCEAASALSERVSLTSQEKMDLEAYGAKMRESGKLD
jgi:aryl-alcohol dehydrogenase-like predicted oxidoreductase